MIENRRIKRLFGWKMPENDGFRDPCGGRHFLGGSPFKSFTGKDFQRRFHKLMAAVGTRHTRARLGLKHFGSL
jgi:hypothetical protein